MSFLQRLKKQFFHTPINSSDALLQALKESEENHIIDSHSRSLRIFFPCAARSDRTFLGSAINGR
jgi:Mg2+/Co2+ transporter CorC